MNIMTRISDFEGIEDGRRMLDLTSVSDGTLVTCAKKSGIFGSGDTLSTDPEYLYAIKHAWMLFTQSTLNGDYRSWVDNWHAFIDYAKTASEAFKQKLLGLDGVILDARFDENSPAYLQGEVPYTLFLTPSGRVKVYDDGRVIRGTTYLGHAVTLMLHNLKALH